MRPVRGRYGDVVDVVAIRILRRFKVWRRLERHHPGAGVDVKLRCVRSAQGIAQGVERAVSVAGRGGVDRARGVLCKTHARPTGDSGCVVIEVVDAQRDGLLGRVACGVGGQHREAVAGLGLKVWIAAECHFTAAGVDAQAGIAARFEAVAGRAADVVDHVGRGCAVDHVAGADVFVHAGCRTRGDARGDFVQVVDRQCDGLLRGVARRVGGQHREAVVRLALKVRIGVERYGAAAGVDAQAGIAARFEAEGRCRAGACITSGGRGRRVHNMASADVFVHVRCRARCDDGRRGVDAVVG